jgi:hypothetical protein
MEIQRRVEKAIAKHLATEIPGGRFVAAEEDDNTEPPYVVVAVDDEASQLGAGDESASTLVVDVIRVTHLDEDNAAGVQSAAVGLVRAALACLRKGFHPNSDLQNAGVMIHGFDVMTSVRVTAGKARGHAITLTVGAGLVS